MWGQESWWFGGATAALVRSDPTSMDMDGLDSTFDFSNGQLVWNYGTIALLKEPGDQSHHGLN